MKPVDLFDAMDGIAEKYIDEAERAFAQNPATPSGNTQAAAEIKTESGGNSREAVKVQPGHPSAQERQSRISRSGTNSIQPVLQRITTGIVAAAACAVFVGGGWFIARQAKQNQSDSISSTLEIGKTNILGGSGALHAAGSTALVYDDNRFYFDYLAATGSRNPGTPVSDAVPSGQESTVLIYDNKYLYIADGFSLYRLNENGIPEAEPFFTVDEKTIERAKQEFQNTNPDVNDIFAESFSVQRLTEDQYFIYITVSNSAVSQGLCGAAFFAVSYNAATGESSDILDYGTATQPAPVSTDGTAFYFKPYGFDGFCRQTLDPYESELFSVPEDMYISSGCGYENWIVQGHTAYYVTPGEDHDFANVKYCQYDMETKTCSVYEESPDFRSFLVSDGMLYACNKAGTQIYCATPELKNITVLFDYEQDVPEDIKANVSAALKENSLLHPIAWLDTADGNYLYAHLADCTYILLDRQTGEKRFYQLPKEEKPQIERTPDETEVSGDAVNALGGKGVLYPVGWTNHGEVLLLRDNDNYYYFDTTVWFSCPLAGSQFTIISYPENGDETHSGWFSEQYAFPYNGFVSDGERIYTDDLDIVSDGSADNHFTPAAVQEYQRSLNAEAEPKGWLYHCNYIWHIRDRYFIVMHPNSIAGAAKLENLANVNYEVWTDENGSILSCEKAQEGTSTYYCSDDKCEMFAIINNNLYSLIFPGDDTEGISDPSAFGMIIDAYCAGEEAFYVTADNALYTRVNGQPVLIDGDEQYGGGIQLAPDRRFFYVEVDISGDALFLWNDSEKSLIYQPESVESLYLCGFEPNESGGYSIILFQWDKDANDICFVLIDAATYEIVKKLTIQFA